MAARFSKACGFPYNGNIPEPFHGFATITPSGPRWTGRVEVIESKLEEPLHWRKPRNVSVNSMSDLFHEALPDEAINRVFAVMALCPQHTFQVLTKRGERLRSYWNAQGLPRRLADAVIATAVSLRLQTTGICGPAAIAEGIAGGWRLPLRNVWLGVSVEDQATADERIPLLLQTPAAVRFVSAEPLLGLVDIRSHLAYEIDNPGADGPLDWLIVGGELGPGARPMHPGWARSVRDQCVAAGVPFFFKQWGEWVPVPLEDISGSLQARMVRAGDVCVDADGTVQVFDGRISVPNEGTGFPMRRLGKRAAGRLLDGREWNEMPGRKA
jgi:protein gp37